MTEAEWLACRDPFPMLRFLEGKASERKAQLFGCACCLRVNAFVPEGLFRDALVLVEQSADGKASTAEAKKVQRKAAKALKNLQPGGSHHEQFCAASAVEAMFGDDALDNAQQVSGRTASVYLAGVRPSECLDPPPFKEELAAQSDLLRCVIGNPFRPAVVNPAWLTSDVRTLAEGIYSDRAFDRMLILADALQDAGCDNDDVLRHCRSNAQHVRGCWVVDLLTGRK